MRVVFMGTPEYAVKSLDALRNAGHEILAVFTQPDRPKGRGGHVAMPPVKERALALEIPVYQPRRIRTEGLDALKALQPDICVTAAFGQILSEEILAVPTLGTVNVHASLLPRYRGSAPVNWAIIMGEETSGVTTMQTDKGIDTGDILLQESTPIGPDETAGELTGRLADIGARLLVKTLELIAKGQCPRRSQEEGAMSYYPMITRETGAVDWKQEAEKIAALARGLNPWPGAFAMSPWGPMKILKARALPWEGKGDPGDILTADARQGLVVKAGGGALRIVEMQMPGGQKMLSEDFLRGHSLPESGRMENGVKNT